MNAVIDWTYLPWEDQGMAGNICWVCFVVGVLFLLITQIIRRTNLGYDIHCAPFVSMECTVLALVINMAAYTLFFWYAAWAVSLVFSFAFYLSARGMQNTIPAWLTMIRLKCSLPCFSSPSSLLQFDLSRTTSAFSSFSPFCITIGNCFSDTASYCILRDCLQIAVTRWSDSHISNITPRQVRRYNLFSTVGFVVINTTSIM